MDSNGLNGNQSTRDSEVPNNADERCDATFSDELDGGRTSSSSLKDIRSSDEHVDECLTPEMKYERTHRSSSPPPLARRGLEHCITAPVTIGGGLFPEGQDMAFSRSLTERRVSPRHNLILDRLSERGKQKLIVDLVKIQGDGTVEVDLTKNFNKSVPKLKIVVLIVGTRGDVQPFLAMAKRLQAFGHHVRLATHSNFRDFVKSGGIDFYPLGGDPRVLTGYMARNKGLIPSGPGEISVQRKQLKAIIESLLPACTEPDIETGEPFRAQAIIANPPAYGHAHVAEALGVPLHIFFTMPWTPTYEFPHPLARVPQPAAYWLSYIVVDLLIWWGIRGLINEFRKKKLNLPPIAYFSTYHGSLSHFPTGYMWSPHVVPKPKDWGSLVDIVGYCVLNLGSNYQPPEDFIKWIQNGPKPVYIGFGSMPLEDTIKTTDIILEALRNTGQRGILDRGWGDLGTFQDIPEDVFLVAEYPHDWLFPQCAAVVHHGGAGTTAAGLRAGCPTTIVPFFGDQFFWGDRIHQKGLGPAPIPIEQLSVEGLSDAITFMLQSDVKSRVMELAVLLEKEDGVAGAVDAFHRHLPSEMPLPTPSYHEDIDGPNPLQWLFTRIGRICCLPCGS
ncbi:sterol 3-beta-glucosyltransferase UGT80B1 isoform X2 [Solanum tuberosum]|uniref:sterol 3-beta-glucosyltransferase UGT80B1 isoform X2 n=1 Tax=Solanum tuberosum TaxID=4113 RepID=UPI00073A2EC7|nr:PREDICTED: sterol 3-beta-glucosyltransferase UGT80B1 isoform X2 [Solanum tuberosum]